MACILSIQTGQNAFHRFCRFLLPANQSDDLYLLALDVKKITDNLTKNIICQITIS